jgi:hypothetical protein
VKAYCEFTNTCKHASCPRRMPIDIDTTEAYCGYAGKKVALLVDNRPDSDPNSRFVKMIRAKGKKKR